VSNLGSVSCNVDHITDVHLGLMVVVMVVMVIASTTPVG
jgi:hypothetical protein